MVEVLRYAYIVLVLILSYQIKEIVFLSSDTVGWSIEGKELISI